MKEIGLYDAKTSLSALVQEVEETGVEIVLTRHGKPVARLAPVQNSLSAVERQAVVDAMLARRDARLEPDEPFDWKAAIEEGRM